ncbi:MAG: hypothetical protein IIA61_08765 [Candidatus Marinimicrobia bacterium]|nr:hypothetical protein [Candidatus Neomarinimicrobiota bacterium]
MYQPKLGAFPPAGRAGAPFWSGLIELDYRHDLATGEWILPASFSRFQAVRVLSGLTQQDDFLELAIPAGRSSFSDSIVTILS